MVLEKLTTTYIFALEKSFSDIFCGFIPVSDPSELFPMEFVSFWLVDDNITSFSSAYTLTTLLQSTVKVTKKASKWLCIYLLDNIVPR